MLLIRCPYCEEDRPEIEFRHAGEAHIARPANIAGISDQEFEAYLFLRNNHKGIVFERWRHIHGCGRFFNAVRHTVSDKFVTTYKVGRPKPEPTAEEIAAVTPKGKDTPANEPIVSPPATGRGAR